VQSVSRARRDAAAGLDGIEKKIDPGPPINKNIYKMSHRERRHLRIDGLPGNLSEALDEAREERLVRDTLGSTFRTFRRRQTRRMARLHQARLAVGD
jgi:glutamine synthetase